MNDLPPDCVLEKLGSEDFDREKFIVCKRCDFDVCESRIESLVERATTAIIIRMKAKRPAP